MKVNSVMSYDVRISSPDETLLDAARAMAENDTGALPVGDNDRLVGMITDRDIAVRGVAQGMGPDARVRDVMTSDVKYCFEDDDTEDVCRNLGEQQIRRIPVLNRDKRLVGILSLGDLARGAANGDAGVALAEISRPGGRHTQSASV